jgi:hypothetical protein
MVSPWIHYEAYDIKVINNLIHDTDGAGLGVNGGYNILLAFNTLYQVGRRSHMLEVTFGNRSCDGNPGDAGRDACHAYLAAGGWGTTVIDDGSNSVRIPSRNVYIYDNVMFNPAGYVSPQIFSIAGPYNNATQGGSNVPRPANVDDNLQIRGNVIFDAGVSELGLDATTGCTDAASACSPAQIVATNTINVEPSLAANADSRPTSGSNLFNIRPWQIPSFTWSDAPTSPQAPAGDLSNLVLTDRDGLPRTSTTAVGAFVSAGSGKPGRRRSVRH